MSFATYHKHRTSAQTGQEKSIHESNNSLCNHLAENASKTPFPVKLMHSLREMWLS